MSEGWVKSFSAVSLGRYLFSGSILTKTLAEGVNSGVGACPSTVVSGPVAKMGSSGGGCLAGEARAPPQPPPHLPRNGEAAAMAEMSSDAPRGGHLRVHGAAAARGSVMSVAGLSLGCIWEDVSSRE